MFDVLFLIFVLTFFVSLFGFLLFGAATGLRLREIDPEKAKELGIPDDESLGLIFRPFLVLFIIRRGYTKYADANIRKVGNLAFYPAVGWAITAGLFILYGEISFALRWFLRLF